MSFFFTGKIKKMNLEENSEEIIERRSMINDLSSVWEDGNTKNNSDDRELVELKNRKKED